MNIFGEITCYGQCLRSWAPFVAFIVGIIDSLSCSKLDVSESKKKASNICFCAVSGLLAITLTYYLMNCSEMLYIISLFSLSVSFHDPDIWCAALL